MSEFRLEKMKSLVKDRYDSNGDPAHDFLFKLTDRFNTEAARAEAQKRVSFMKTFVYQLETEVTAHALA